MRPTGNARWIAVSLKLGTILAPLAAITVAIMALAPGPPAPHDERAAPIRSAPIRSAPDVARAAAQPPVVVGRAAHGI